jgi:hypothetical protein
MTKAYQRELIHTVAARDSGKTRVKETPGEQKHFIHPVAEKGVQGAQKTRWFFFAPLCVFARRLTDELFDFFARSYSVGYPLPLE